MNEEGKFLWPGFGENLRVLRWVLGRVHGEIGAAETPIGYLPHPAGIDVTGLDVTPEALRELLAIDRAGWREAVTGQQEFFKQFGDRMPREMWQESEALARRLQWMPFFPRPLGEGFSRVRVPMARRNGLRPLPPPSPGGRGHRGKG